MATTLAGLKRKTRDFKGVVSQWYVQFSSRGRVPVDKIRRRRDVSWMYDKTEEEQHFVGC